MSAHVDRVEPVSPCMGGWCTKREKCLHYADPDNKHRPAERLCESGRELFTHFKQYVMFRAPA
jgi:hypothetical protein